MVGGACRARSGGETTLRLKSLKERDNLGRSTHRLDANIKMDIIETDFGGVVGFIWLSIGASGKPL